MFCPRCGRAVSETANFCGGCGLSRVEIEKYIQQTQQAAVTETPKTEEVKTEVPFGTIVNEPVKTAPAEPVVETVTAQTGEPAAEAVTANETEAVEAAEPMPEAVVDAVAEMVDEKAQAPEAEPAAEAPKAAYTPPVPPQPQHDYGTQYSYAQPQYTQQPVPAKNENLSTVDFIWMMFISSIPFVGFIYLVYLAVQNNNTNKRSYARATLLIALFSVVVAVIFAFGFVAAGVF